MSDVAAGWYPDPYDPDALIRWWDRQAWTDVTRAVEPVPVAEPPTLIQAPQPEPPAQVFKPAPPPPAPAYTPPPAPIFSAPQAGSSDRPWWKKKRFAIPAGAVAVLIVAGPLLPKDEDKDPNVEAVARSAESTTTNTAAAETTTREATTTTTAEATTTTAAETTTTTRAPTTQATPSLTPSQKNAIESAKSYLDFSGFSRQGLIDQLSSDFGDQYSVEDATFAVDSLEVDWNEQAVREAQSYIDFSSFSCRGLIDQLSSEFGGQFTVEQATHGATAVGLC